MDQIGLFDADRCDRNRYRTKWELALSATAPLQLVFDRPLDEVRQRLEALVEASPEYSSDSQSRNGTNSTILSKPPLDYAVCWTHQQLALSGYRAVFVESPLGKKVTTLSIDFGPHLQGGPRVAPLVKALLGFAAELAEKLEANAVVWTPGKLISDASFFVENVKGYIAGGVFPVLVTVDFDYFSNELELHSTGLSWFAGQEMVLAGCDLRGQQLVRRAVRLVHDIAINGPVVMTQLVSDLDDDKLIELMVGEPEEALRCQIRSRVDQKTSVSVMQ